MLTWLKTKLSHFGGALIVGFGIAAVATHRSDPSDSALAVKSIENALKALSSKGVDSATAISRYKAEMLTAERLLRRALLDYPNDSTAIRRLAAVLWELSITTGATDQDAVSDLVQMASARTPRRPETQIELGELLYRTGRFSEASQRFADALALAPSQTRRVVELMLSFGSSPTDIARVLTATPELLVSIQKPCLQAGLDQEFKSLVDGSLNTWPAELLPMYGDICLRTGCEEELLRRLSAPFDPPSIRVEALRRIQRGRALARLGRSRAALLEANEARKLAPVDSAVLEALGEVAIESGDATLASETLRLSLTLLVGGQQSPLLRGRVYRKLGQAQELDGKPEQAFDSYRRAIQLNPDETFARVRLEQMATAAGLRP